MEVHEIWSSVIAITVMLIFSAYFSATETAFTSLNRIRIKNKADDGDVKAKRVLKLNENYENMLSTILVANNVVNIGTTAVATVLFISLYGDLGATISTIVTTLLVLTFGEITPKSLAKEHAEGFAMFSAPGIGFLMIILWPVNKIFSQWRRLVSLLLKAGNVNAVNCDELITIVDEAEVQGSISAQHSILIKNAINFSEFDALDVLTPRVDIEAVELDTPKEEIDEKFLETGFSRLPVYEDDLDNILGVLTQKDFHDFVLDKDKEIADFVKPVIYVAGSMKIHDILRKLQENECRMAIIVDEYGGTLGIVTSEDIVEELVGEIYDDTDTVADKDITRLQNGSYRILGSANIEKIFDFLGNEEEFEETTVNGWVVRQLDKLPKVGDTFEYPVGEKLFSVKVTKSDGRKATEINLFIIDDPRKEEGKH